MLNRLRAEIKADSGYRLPLDELADIVVSCVLRPEVQDGKVDKQLKRVQRAAKAPKKANNASSDARCATEG